MTGKTKRPYIHLTNPTNLESIDKYGILKGVGGLGQGGVYCVSLFKDSSIVNIFSLITDYFDKHDTVGVILFTATDDNIIHGDINTHHEGNSLCTKEVPRCDIISISEMNENTFRTVIVDTFISGVKHDDFIAKYPLFYEQHFNNKLSTSYLIEKLINGLEDGTEVNSTLELIFSIDYIVNETSQFHFIPLTNCGFDKIVSDNLNNHNSLVSQLRKYLTEFYSELNYQKTLPPLRSSLIFNNN